jgi:hypothetical protein
VCKKASLGAEIPFTTLVAITSDEIGLSTFSITEFVTSMLANKQIKLIPMYGCMLSFQFVEEDFTRAASVAWCTVKGMCTIHVYTRDGLNVNTPLPLKKGIHTVVVQRGAMHKLER